MTDPAWTAWRRLGYAVLVRAWKDAQATNGDKAAREAGLPKGVTLTADACQFLESDAAQGCSWPSTGRWAAIAGTAILIRDNEVK